MAVTDPQRDFYSRLLTSYGGRTLRRGAKGKTVRALQLFLRDKGYDIAADGDFGKQTEAALRAWQKSEGLSADGQAGRRSLTRMRESTTPLPRQRPSAPPKRPSFAEAANMPKSRAQPAPGPTSQPDAGIAPTGLPASLESVPTGVGAEQAAFSAAQQVPPDEGMSDYTSAMMGQAPGIIDPAYPVGAGGARPNPTRRPLPGASPPAPAPLPEEVPVAGGPLLPPPDLAGGPSALAQALTGTSAPPPPLSGEPMGPLPPENAMQMAQLPPLNQTGGFPPGAQAATDATGAMTPETIALIQALLQGRMPQQMPPQSVPAF